MAVPSASLERRLGPLDAAAIVISNVIGSGIFFVPMLVAQSVPDAPAMLLLWLAGGGLAFAGAMAYAELAALRPKAGGEYVYLREAYGPLPAFLSGWTSFVAGFSGAIAAGAVAFAESLGRFVPAVGSATPFVTIPLPFVELAISPATLTALAVIAVITAVHIRGLGPGRVVQNGLASIKVGALFGFVIAGFAIGRGDMSHLVERSPAAASGVAMLAALIPIMFTYSGWNAAAYVAEEVREPERNVPRALALGTAVVVTLYLALNALYLFALGPQGLATDAGTLSDRSALRLFGVATGELVAAFTLASIAASISAMVLTGPRVYFAMARDGLFFDRARHVHPRFRTPVAAILAQAAWSGVLVLSGTLSQLVSYTGFAIVMFSGAAVAAVFVLRRRTNVPKAFAAWGYPWAPALFVVMSGAMLVSDVARNPGPAIAGLAVIAAGVPVYWFSKARLRTS